MHKLLSNNPLVLQIQEELKAGMTLEQTAAGSQLSADLDVVITTLRAEIKKVRKEMEDAIKAKDKAWHKVLNDELWKLKEDMSRSFASKEQLSRPPYVPLFQLVNDLTK
jgi:flagellar biosynthesis chaperone FliJ